MIKVVSAFSAIAWLGAVFMFTPIPFIHLVQWQGRFDPIVVLYDAIAVCGIALALVAAIRCSRWARLSALVLSIPAACGSLLALFPLLSLLHPTGILRHAVQSRGTQAYLWISFVVVLLMICMPVLWALVCFQSRRHATA
jgi:hypothetical protein